MSVLCELEDFYLNFSGSKSIIGYSVENRPIYCFEIVKTNYPRIIVQYEIHAREYITTYLAMRQINEYIAYGKKGAVCFIPALNPDGIVRSITDKPLYKANARGVDLNVNFDARWGTGKNNIFVKSDENFVGDTPFSEPETKALRDLTLNFRPHATLSYHSKGEEIYYEFFQDKERLERDKFLAKQIQEVTSYDLKRTPNSAGGYKDWCIEYLKIPAFTIEVGSDNLIHPIGKENLQDIFLRNRKVINVLTENV